MIAIKLSTQIKRLLIIIILLLGIIVICLSEFFGKVGYTKKTSAEGSLYYGCNCHGIGEPIPTIKVWVTGPESVAIGAIVRYKIHIKGGPATAGGFNVSTFRGTLMIVESDSTRLDLPDNYIPPYDLTDFEITHSAPKLFTNDTIFWEFDYKAPDTTCYDTLYSAGNSTNLSGDTYGDEYNFGGNFIIKVIQSDGVEEFNTINKFHLSQNYPNPFNPSTVIIYQLPKDSRVTLRIYNLLGQEVKTLVNEIQNVGFKSVVFDASALGELSSGVYFYRILAVGQDGILSYSDVKKMILIR